MGDVIGAAADLQDSPFVAPNLPANNPQRTSSFSKPYPDVAVPGLSLVTAMAPVYFTGSFHGHDYDDTYIASVGVDISIVAVSSYLDVLQDTLTKGSFGVLVDADFHTIVISEHVVKKIYPTRTGMEEARVSYDTDGTTIVQDRRDQPYLPSDTIHQPLVDLSNANWNSLKNMVDQTSLGQRGLATLNVTLTGDKNPTHFHVMFDRWLLADKWTLLVFTPVEELTKSIDVFVSAEESVIELVGVKGEEVLGKSTIVNQGYLDVFLSIEELPYWLSLSTATGIRDGKLLLVSGTSITIEFMVATEYLDVGSKSFPLTIRVEDADYPDCLYNNDLSTQIDVFVLAGECDDSSRTPDENGVCICQSGRIEIASSCVTVGMLIAMLLIVLVGLLILVMFVAWRKTKRAENSWRLDNAELKYDEPPQVLGKGGFGVVFLAEYRGMQVAVKRLNGHGSSMSTGMRETAQSASNRNGSSTSKNKALADFAADMRLLSSLRHPNITAIIGGVVPQKGDPLIVMEYMENKSLADLIHKSTVALEEEIILGILRDVTKGIQFLHNAKPSQVIHGDIKASQRDAVAVSARF